MEVNSSWKVISIVKARKSGGVLNCNKEKKVYLFKEKKERVEVWSRMEMMAIVQRDETARVFQVPMSSV